MDIVSTLWVVERQARSEFWNVFGMAVIACIGFVLFMCMMRYLLPIMTRWIVWMKSHRMQVLMVAPMVVCLIHVGATKQTVGHVTYPFTDVEMRYLYDAGSYVTNDFVHVAFSKSAVVPDSADFLGYVRPCGSTNDEDWVAFLSSTFAEFHSPSNVPFAGALTNDFEFFTTYTPGPVVHTNGVAVVNWQKSIGGGTNNLVPIRTGFYVEGQRVAPNPAITNGPLVIYFNLNQGGAENE